MTTGNARQGQITIMAHVLFAEIVDLQCTRPSSLAELMSIHQEDNHGVMVEDPPLTQTRLGE